jgi:hypothetical protein
MLSFCVFELGFFSSKADHSLIIFRAPPLEIFVLIYVDDILISSMAAIDALL